MKKFILLTILVLQLFPRAAFAFVGSPEQAEYFANHTENKLSSFSNPTFLLLAFFVILLYLFLTTAGSVLLSRHILTFLNLNRNSFSYFCAAILIQTPLVLLEVLRLHYYDLSDFVLRIIAALIITFSFVVVEMKRQSKLVGIKN